MIIKMRKVVTSNHNKNLRWFSQSSYKVRTIIWCKILAKLAMVFMVILHIFTNLVIYTVNADIITTKPHTTKLEDWPTDEENTCVLCHGDSPTTILEEISANCVNDCHSKEASDVSSSKHSGLKCVYCHPVLHVGYEDNGTCKDCHNTVENKHNHEGKANFASVWLLNYSYKPNQLVTFKEVFHSYTNIELMSELEIDTTQRGNIYMAYLDSDGRSSGSNFTRYLTCLNCHYLAEDSKETGELVTTSEGVIKISVFRINQEFREHQLVLRDEEILVEEQFDLMSQILPAIIAITIITIMAVSLRRRGRAKSSRDDIQKRKFGT